MRMQVKQAGYRLLPLLMLFMSVGQCVAGESPSPVIAGEAGHLVMVDMLYRDGLKEVVSGNRVEAEKLFSEVLASDPGHRQARLQQGRLLIEAGRPYQAMMVLSPLLHGARAGWEPWFWMGTASLLIDDYDKAANDFDTAISYDSGQAVIWIQRAIVEQERARYPAALKLLDVALKLSPESPMVWLNIATVYELMQNTDKADQAYRRFLQLSSGEARFSAQRKKVVSRLLGRLSSTATPP